MNSMGLDLPKPIVPWFPDYLQEYRKAPRPTGVSNRLA